MLQKRRAFAAMRSPRAPAAVFAAASLFFGTLIAFVTPPLRGHDETAHFLRAYGLAMGDFIPSTRDAQGRKGVLLPAPLYAGFAFFEDERTREKTPAWGGYAPVFAEYWRQRQVAPAPDAPPRFVPYAGSEGYSPMAYLPQSTAASVARALDCDFLTTLWLMRLASVIAFTALIAWAIALLPQFGWALAAIAMLPSALYARAIVSADAGALAAAAVVVALWLRGFIAARVRAVGELGLWLLLGALTKPVNVAFALPARSRWAARWPGTFGRRPTPRAGAWWKSPASIRSRSILRSS